MNRDMDITGVKIGPVILGQVTERQPETASDKRWKLVTWLITVLLIAIQAPFLGFILILGTAVYLAAQTAPSDDKGNQS